MAFAISSRARLISTTYGTAPSFREDIVSGAARRRAGGPRSKRIGLQRITEGPVSLVRRYRGPPPFIGGSMRNNPPCGRRAGVARQFRRAPGDAQAKSPAGEGGALLRNGGV